jgi:predicted phage baseplate assembly protein
MRGEVNKMPLETTKLDDRTYKQIIKEAKKLIPQYAPDWTDWNESDPGIALIELFAWLTEMILYRLNKVPDNNFIEFLKLVGIELKAAEPASVDLTFTLTEGAESAVIPKGTQVSFEADDEEEPVIFETEEALVALGVELKAVQVYDGLTYESYTEANSVVDSGEYYAFGSEAAVGSALCLGFYFDGDFPDKEIKLTFNLHTEDLISKGSHCVMDENGGYSSARVKWEYLNGTTWAEFNVSKDSTKALLNSGSVYLEGTSLLSESKLDESQDEKLYWIRCRLLQSDYEVSPRIDTVLINTVTAKSVVTVKGEILGSSNGESDQKFTLKNKFIIKDSLILQVDEGDGWETWTEMDNFYSSSRNDKHYVLNRLSGEIKFGNGEKGKIPLPHPGGSNIMALEYRYGGGKSGNAGKEKITELESSVPYVDSVTNLRAASGGKDEETVAEAKIRGPKELKTRHRAVTAEDFEFLAEETPGVRIRRAKALPLYHPDFPGCEIPGVISVIIVPDSKKPNPMPSESTIKTVCEHLNKHRLLTSEVYVLPPTYVKIKVEAEIIAEAGADSATVENKLEKNLKDFFHPLNGGTDKKGWPFGGDIYYSDVYKIVIDTKGVERVDSLIIYKDDEKQDECENVKISGNNLLYSGKHNLNVTYERE